MLSLFLCYRRAYSVTVHFKSLGAQKGWILLTNTWNESSLALQTEILPCFYHLIINLFTLGIKGEREH